MNAIQLLKRLGLDLLKGVGVAVAYFVGLIIGGMVTRALGLPAVEMPASMMNLSVLMPRLFISEVLIAMILGECFGRLFEKYWQRAGLLWLCHYVLYAMVNTLDAFLYTTYGNLGTSFVSSLFPTLFAAAVLAWLWRPTKDPATARPSLAAYFSARPPADWGWRFVAAWLCFPPIYYLAGRVVAIFTLSYYQDQSHQLGLTLNLTLESMLAMQVLRGALFLLAVLPMILAWRGSRKALWLQVGLVIFVQVAIQTILQAYWMPLAAVRLPHGLEMLADSFAQAAVYAWLLLPPPAVAAVTEARRQTQPAL